MMALMTMTMTMLMTMMTMTMVVTWTEGCGVAATSEKIPWEPKAGMRLEGGCWKCYFGNQRNGVFEIWKMLVFPKSWNNYLLTHLSAPFELLLRRLVTFETFDQIDEETWPDQKKMQKFVGKQQFENLINVFLTSPFSERLDAWKVRCTQLKTVVGMGKGGETVTILVLQIQDWWYRILTRKLDLKSPQIWFYQDICKNQKRGDNLKCKR